MPVPTLQCPACRAPLPAGVLTADGWAACPGCSTPTRVEAFPALLRAPTAGRAAEAIVLDGEASCFYHPEKKAEVPCAECGRFLCALCDVELNDRHLCPTCLEAGTRKGQLIELEQRRTRYDTVALTLTLAPILAWPFTIATAPAAIAIAIYGARKPRSLVSRYWQRAGVAIALATAQLGGWVALIYSMVTSN